MPGYILKRDPENGQLLYVQNYSTGRGFGPNDPEWQEFLAWNSTQNPPNPTDVYVFPSGHVVCRDISQVVAYCQENGVVLYLDRSPNGGVAFEFSDFADFPGIGRVCNVRQAGKGREGAEDGIAPRPSPIWVDQELVMRTMPRRVFDENEGLRRVSAWTITRTFVYLDISDFSRFPPGQQMLVINSLVGLVQNRNLWNTYPVLELCQQYEAMICIGDGYIFVFKDPLEATYFAAYLARLIELMVAKKRLQVDFHFRMGVHVGPVYTFWDPGRKNWNYIGAGINGGNRVLSAIDKSYDDILYISGDVREAILAAPRHGDLFDSLLRCLHNRGRRADKHGNPWRVYELNHTDLYPNHVMPSDVSLQHERV